AQQLSLSAGVAVGALVVEVERMGRIDNTVVAGEFPLAFLIVAVIAASSLFVFSMLPKEAGSSLSARARPLASLRKQHQPRKPRAGAGRMQREPAAGRPPHGAEGCGAHERS